MPKMLRTVERGMYSLTVTSVDSLRKISLVKKMAYMT
jgi:hypothetical protein